MKNMRTLLLDIASFMISMSGVTGLIRRLFYKHTVTVLVYHDPESDIFEKHVGFLRKRYTIIDIDTAITSIRQNDFSALGNYPLVITIDDGHRNNICLLPVIKKFNIRPCVYLCSGIMNTHRAISDIYTQKNDPEKLKKFKEQTESSKRKMFNDMYSLSFETELPTRATMTLEEMEMMKPWVDYGSHGKFHQAIPFLSESEMHAEIFDSKLEIENLLSIKCHHFAFPSGYYDEKSSDMVRQAGYSSARTTEPGANNKPNNLFYLKVTGASDDASVYKLDVQSVGIYRTIKKFINIIGGKYRHV